MALHKDVVATMIDIICKHEQNRLTYLCLYNMAANSPRELTFNLRYIFWI